MKRGEDGGRKTIRMRMDTYRETHKQMLREFLCLTLFYPTSLFWTQFMVKQRSLVYLEPSLLLALIMTHISEQTQIKLD